MLSSFRRQMLPSVATRRKIDMNNYELKIVRKSTAKFSALILGTLTRARSSARFPAVTVTRLTVYRRRQFSRPRGSLRSPGFGRCQVNS
eukprot:5784019-Pyramimonas_sp.AAC.1